MKINKHKPDNPTYGSEEYFTGKVIIESNFSGQNSDHYSGAVVKFDKGARTAWHMHPLGQTLVVISGRGLVQQEGKAIEEILPGDVVWIPPNTRHWHGGAPDSAMSHVAIIESIDGKGVEWMEHVSDEEYLGNS